MHIMHVIDGLGLGGAERMLVDIANATAAHGASVSVCVTRSCTDMASSLNPGIKIHTLGRRRRFEVKPLRRFARIVREQRVDVLHAHSRSTFSMLALLKMLGWLRVPVIFHDHYGWIETKTSVPIWFRFAGRRFLDYYVGVYAKLGEWAQRAGVPGDRVEVIGNAIDLSRFTNDDTLDIRKAFSLEGSSRVGVVVAGIRPEKGIEMLLKALALGPLPPATRILIIGGVPDKAYSETIKQLVVSLRLEETVSFVGMRSDVPAILKGVDFALLPSRSESGPLVLVEYMLAGLPFVSTQVGDLARRAAEAGVPEFVPPDDPSAFRGALDRLLALSPDAWRSRAATGRQVALEHFDIRNTMPRWYQIYHKVLACKSP